MAGAGSVEVGGIASITLAGGVAWTVASMNVDGGTVTAASGAAVSLANLNFSSGILDGPGTLTLTGQANVVGRDDERQWFDGGRRGSQPATGGGPLATPEILDTRTLSNAGTATFVGGAFLTAFDQRNGSAFDNLPGASLNIDTSFNWDNDQDDSTLNNQGTIVKSGDAGDHRRRRDPQQQRCRRGRCRHAQLGRGHVQRRRNLQRRHGSDRQSDRRRNDVTYSGTLTGSGRRHRPAQRRRVRQSGLEA